MKYMVYIAEKLLHAVVIEADNEQEIKDLFNQNKIDWAACDVVDCNINIDSIEELESPST